MSSTMKELTKRQSKIFNYIKQHLLINGYQPTQREIAEHFSINNVNGVACHLKLLQKKGYIRITGVQRGLKILK